MLTRIKNLMCAISFLQVDVFEVLYIILNLPHKKVGQKRDSMIMSLCVAIYNLSHKGSFGMFVEISFHLKLYFILLMTSIRWVINVFSSLFQKCSFMWVVLPSRKIS